MVSRVGEEARFVNTRREHARLHSEQRTSKNGGEHERTCFQRLMVVCEESIEECLLYSAGYFVL